MFKKNSIAAVLVAFFVFVVLGLAYPNAALAVPAIAPSLGTAATFSVLAGTTMTADASGATISGDLGVSPGLAATGTWTHTGGSD